MTSVPYESPTTNTSNRICKNCQQTYPITEFRRRTQSDSRRMYQCRLCHNQAEQLRRQRKRGWLAKHQFHQYLTSLNNQRTARGVEKVYTELVRLCGGTEGILRMWTEVIGRDLAAGGMKAHRHIASILRLMEYCEDKQPEKPDYSTMSDEELLEKMSRSVLD